MSWYGHTYLPSIEQARAEENLEPCDDWAEERHQAHIAEKRLDPYCPCAEESNENSLRELTPGVEEACDGE